MKQFAFSARHLAEDKKESAQLQRAPASHVRKCFSLVRIITSTGEVRALTRIPLSGNFQFRESRCGAPRRYIVVLRVRALDANF
jgi:hypothetical protein